jgi:hypothetical protein
MNGVELDFYQQSRFPNSPLVLDVASKRANATIGDDATWKMCQYVDCGPSEHI